MEKSYKSPKIDAVLLEDGWIRIGEAPVYFRPVDYGEYKYYFTFPACFDGWIEFEKWLEEGIEGKEGIKEMIKDFGVWGANTYVKEKDALSAHLLLSGDFFYQLRTKEGIIKKEYYENLLQVFLTNKNK